MFRLSESNINARAPYMTSQVDDMSFIFVNKHGAVYTVGFAPDYSFTDSGVYQFFINNTNNVRSPRDNNVYETIRVIIEEFFTYGQPVMLYICDTSDNRQASRSRLFEIWFHTYSRNDLLTLYSETLAIDNTTYYSSLLLRKDHPRHNEMIAQFHDFISMLPDKLENL